MQSTMQGLVDAGDVAGLNAITYHFVQTCWKQLGIDFGGALHGVHAATPSEPLHQIDIGIFKYEIKELFLAIGSKDCKLWSVIDEWVRRIGRYLLHQSDRELPRTYFPNGVSAGTKLAGHKHIGVLVLVLHIMLKMKAPCDAIINNTQPDDRAKTRSVVQSIWVTARLESVAQKGHHINGRSHSFHSWSQTPYGLPEKVCPKDTQDGLANHQVSHDTSHDAIHR
jgi:hypothetical protein